MLVVIVIGLFVVIWNYDLHRVLTAKVRTRNAVDAAAMTGARWQGITLNMIGDLNLIQAAILSVAAEEQDGLAEFTVPGEVGDLHDMRNRLDFMGPLAAFALAQQAAFGNGAMPDPALESDLRLLVDEMRMPVNQGADPYDNASEDYADLLEGILEQGVAVGSYSVSLPGNVLAQESFYDAVAEATGGNWRGMKNYEYWLENYEGADSWPSLNADFRIFHMLDLKLREFQSRAAFSESFVRSPPRSMPETAEDFFDEIEDYFYADERGIISSLGVTDYVLDGMYPFYPDQDIPWHVFDDDWWNTWPKPAGSKDNLEEDEDGDLFPLWGDIQDRYNYMGAEAGFGISAPVHRGIVAGRDNATVTLKNKAKAKPFGYISAAAMDAPPYYFGFVFPVFTDVRLIHSDIGDDMVEPGFYRHVMAHLEAYLAGGVEALNPECHYCRMLQAWESLDRDAGLQWLEDAEESEDSPLDPADESQWDGLKGGASGGS